jgi:hypothetical protein
MSSGHYCDGCAQAYYKCVCNKPQEKVKEQTIKMNERIKELSIQAGFPEWSNHAIEFELEQFAELIVRECGRVYIQNQQDGVMTLTQDLLQHFGVES